MKNTLSDLNNALFEQLERLNDDYGYNTKERTVPKMLASDKEWKG